jgi:hypothetical protein
MKFNKNACLILLIASALSLNFILSSCKKDSPVQVETRNDDDNFIKERTINGLHKIGQSPCPQIISEQSVFCTNSSSASCLSDYAFITDDNPHPGLNVKFSNGIDGSPLEGSATSSSVKLIVEFNCSVPESFKHTFKVSFYKSGTKIKEEEITVNMTVQ